MIKQVLKRDGNTTVDFDESKIRLALYKANDDKEVTLLDKLTSRDVDKIIDKIKLINKDTVTVEEIQDVIEKQIILLHKFSLAKAYITYRFKRALVRKQNTTDVSILGLIQDKNDEVARENSNKKATINSTKRDLIAGEVSKDLSKRYLLPEKIVKANDQGILHFHDMDYFMMKEFNCCLPNFADMLENGTKIHGTYISTPKSFATACNQVTQAMADIASNQYGGQTMYSEVLGKYLAYTREKLRKINANDIGKALPNLDTEDKDKLIDQLTDTQLKNQLKAGVQTIQYQLNTLLTSNGQSPFVTIFMYLRDDDPYEKEHAMIIEEILKQRLAGIPDENGICITPAFPKLVYVIGENNNLKGGKYDYLTELAAECSAKRMYPDYISEKKMKENYNGEVFGCMGCVDGEELITYKYKDKLYMESFACMWKRLKDDGCKELIQPHRTKDVYIDVKDMEIRDTKLKGFTKVQRIIRNADAKFIKLYFSNGKNIKCTSNHIFTTENRGDVEAKDLILNRDTILAVGDIEDTMEVMVTRIEEVEDTDYSYDVTTESEHFEVSGIYSHNCRSFLSEWIDPETGKPKWNGRFNQGVVTLNLPNLALSSGKDFDKFWELFEERLALCHEALMCRHKALEGTLSDVSPIHWQNGAIARLKPGEKIDKLLHDGYSTISLGYIGLYECTKYMTGHSHTEEGGKEFSFKVMNRLREACDTWKKASGIAFGLYGTPAESTCYTLCKKDRETFGVVKDVTDKDFYTNSYHIFVGEPINAFDKLGLESEYQKISSGGAISYVELPNLVNNVDAIKELIKFIYDNVQYGEFNTRPDYCSNCGYEGEITANEKGEWECPNCGCNEPSKIHVTRRTCGYLGTSEAGWNEGKMQEFGMRVLHLH